MNFVLGITLAFLVSPVGPPPEEVPASPEEIRQVIETHLGFSPTSTNGIQGTKTILDENRSSVSVRLFTTPFLDENGICKKQGLLLGLPSELMGGSKTVDKTEVQNDLGWRSYYYLAARLGSSVQNCNQIDKWTFFDELTYQMSDTWQVFNDALELVQNVKQEEFCATAKYVEKCLRTWSRFNKDRGKFHVTSMKYLSSGDVLDAESSIKVTYSIGGSGMYHLWFRAQEPYKFIEAEYFFFH